MNSDGSSERWPVENHADRGVKNGRSILCGRVRMNRQARSNSGSREPAHPESDGHQRNLNFTPPSGRLRRASRWHGCQPVQGLRPVCCSSNTSLTNTRDSDDFAPPVTIPPGASFKDMVALKGKSGIGDKINTQVIQPLKDANKARPQRLAGLQRPHKLGSGKEMVDRLTNLIAIFENPALDFSKNRADGDDILGDAYEYLMRHFATESGKSKGQFYTPAEVSRVIAKVIGIRRRTTMAATTVYDPTCGSGSLLLKVADEAGKRSLCTGRRRMTTAGLARMNMILHDNPTRIIQKGNTLADPSFKDGERLRTYDYVVANPPFSDKTWRTESSPTKIHTNASSMRRTPGEARRLRLPAAHRRSLKSPAKPPASCRTAYSFAAMLRPTSAKTRPLRLPQRHHRTASEPVLRHRHSRLHPRARQRKRRTPAKAFS